MLECKARFVSVEKWTNEPHVRPMVSALDAAHQHTLALHTYCTKLCFMAASNITYAVNKAGALV